jgi:hypothetical protein
MPFSPLATIALTETWQVTPVTEGNYFRFTCSDNIGFTYLLVAQAQVGDSGLIELFESRRFPITVGVAFLDQLISPPVISPEARRLAVRGLAPRSVQAPTLTLDIEASFMHVINPQQNATTQTKQTDVKQDAAAAAAAIAIPANQARNGGVIFNKGNRNLFVGMGFTADSSSPFVVKPAGQISIEPGFVGEISVLFAGADANQVANKTIAQVIELVA